MPNVPLFAPAALAICLGVAVPAAAQAPGPDNQAGSAANATSRTDRRIERIHIEDSGARIDELRVGGETQSITVSPKGGMPAYDILPAGANLGPAAIDRGSSAAAGGTRVWKIFGF